MRQVREKEREASRNASTSPATWRPSSDPSCESSAAYCWSRGLESDRSFQEGHKGQFRPCHYVDYVFGTSTGGHVRQEYIPRWKLTSARLSAMMLGRLHMTPTEAKDQYDVVCSTVFGHPNRSTLRGLRVPHFKTHRMETALQYVTQRRPRDPLPAGGILKLDIEDKLNIRRNARAVRLWSARPHMARTCVCLRRPLID